MVGGGRGEGGGGGLPNGLKPEYGHHRHDALPSLGPKKTSMVPPGQLGVSVCFSACLSYFLSPPSVFVPFCPFFLSFFLSRLCLFVSLFVSSVLLFRFWLSAFVLFFVFFSLHLLSFLLSASLFFLPWGP